MESISVKKQKVLSRYEGFILNRFGVKPQLIESNDLNQSIIPSLRDVLKRNADSLAILTQSHVVLPIRNSGQLLGVMVLLEGSKLLPQEIDQARQVMELIVTSFLIEQQKVSLLSDLEEYLSVQLKSEKQQGLNGQNSVISSFESLDEEDSEDTGFFVDRLADELSLYDIDFEESTPVLLLDSGVTPIREMALEVHRLSQRFAFLSYSDISDTDRRDVQALTNLGKVTLFIPDVLHLTASEKMALEIFIKMNLDNEAPRIICGISLEPAQAVELGILSQGLKELLVGSDSSRKKNLDQRKLGSSATIIPFPTQVRSH
jgi:hypothetical protein